MPPRKVAGSEAEAKLQVAQKEEGSARPRDLLAALRNADQYSDALIVVEDHEFPIHRAIVARLSKFFSNAFSRGFAESKNRKLVVGEASVKAMSTVLDFAYGMDVASVLRQDSDFAFEVWELAHRLQITLLTEIAAATAVEYATVKNSVRTFYPGKYVRLQAGKWENVSVYCETVQKTFLSNAPTSASFRLWRSGNG